MGVRSSGACRLLGRPCAEGPPAAPPEGGLRGPSFLGCAGEPLFVTRALNDQVAVAEADGCANGALLAPQLRVFHVRALVPCRKLGVMALGESLEDVGPLIGEPVDLGFYLLQGTHVGDNAPNH